MAINYSGKTRIESDLLGEMEVPVEALYGVQTLRGIVNFPISRFHLNDYPLFINGLAMTKLGAAEANYQLGLLTEAQYKGIAQACREIMEGQHHDHFVCTSCGKVEEFYDAEIEKRQQLIAKEKGWTVHDHTMALYGQCAACTSKHANK